MSNESPTPLLQVVPAPPMGSLADLRSQNSALLQRSVAGEGTSKPSAGELLGFLTAAQDLGKSLSDLDARETAQGIMDFWIATVISDCPEASEGTRPFSLAPYEEASEKGMEERLHTLRTEAEAAAQRAGSTLPDTSKLPKLTPRITQRIIEWTPLWFQALTFRFLGQDPDTRVLHSVLIRFIRLKEKSLQAYSVPVPADDPIFQDQRAADLLHRLIAAGVVIQQAATPDGPAAYTLVHESLLTSWPTLQEVIKQRVAFRELARGWDIGGHKSTSLLRPGEQMQHALDNPHLEDFEHHFLEESRKAGDLNRSFAIRLMGILTLVLLALAAWQWNSQYQIKFTMAIVEDTQDELTRKEEKLEEVQTQLAKTAESFQEIEKLASQVAVSTSSSAELRADLIRMTAEAEKAKFDLSEAERALRYSLAKSTTAKSMLLSMRDMTLDAEGHWIGDVSSGIPEKIEALLAPIKSGIDNLEMDKPMVEIFVSLTADTGPDGIAMKCWKALTDAGFTVPAQALIPRRVIPDKTDPTEVKYFYPEDKELADRIISILAQAGIPITLEAQLLPDPTLIIQEPKLDDRTAPRNFIQLSLSQRLTD